MCLFDVHHVQSCHLIGSILARNRSLCVTANRHYLFNNRYTSILFVFDHSWLFEVESRRHSYNWMWSCNARTDSEDVHQNCNVRLDPERCSRSHAALVWIRRHIAHFMQRAFGFRRRAQEFVQLASEFRGRAKEDLQRGPEVMKRAPGFNRRVPKLQRASGSRRVLRFANW